MRLPWSVISVRARVCVCVCVCLCVGACVRVVVRETDISRWVYVYVRVGVWEAVILCIVAFCRRTDLSVHLPVQFNLPFWQNTFTSQLIYWSTSTRK